MMLVVRLGSVHIYVLSFLILFSTTTPTTYNCYYICDSDENMDNTIPHSQTFINRQLNCFWSFSYKNQSFFRNLFNKCDAANSMPLINRLFRVEFSHIRNIFISQLVATSSDIFQNAPIQR